MDNITEIKDQIRRRLETAGLGYHRIDVFGAIRLNVHITCKSRGTAQKWEMLLSGSLGGSKVSVTKTMWAAAKNSGTCLRPTMHHGYLVAIAA